MTTPPYTGEPYPVLITQARYSGVYEGGRWVGFIADGVPPDAFSHDTACSIWWRLWGDSPAVAVGDTPDQVLALLIEQNPGEQFPDTLPLEAYAQVSL